MSNSQARKVEIVIRGDDEGDIELALDEAFRKVKEGYLAGHDSNDTGAYYFNVSDNVPDGQLPA